ncbi:MAG: hypothetical protein IKZ42_02715 [Clostridiales bacterium]|nr:hypothetical protein [Clostridiales bacterium]
MTRTKKHPEKNAGKFVSVILLLSFVCTLLSSCQIVDADYIFYIDDSGKKYYYSITGDEVAKISSVQYNLTVEFQEEFQNTGYLPANCELSVISIQADSDDPADWKLFDDDNNPLDPEQEQMWNRRLCTVSFPYKGSVSVITNTFDEYTIAYINKLDHRELQYITAVVIFHNDKSIGILEHDGLLHGLYKNSQ